MAHASLNGCWPGCPTPAAWADAKRLRQVLLNLLSNAIKYNQSGGLVVVETEHQDGLLTFRVRDSGPGLTADEQQRLFRPFERLGAARRSVDGTGIGLALSRYSASPPAAAGCGVATQSSSGCRARAFARPQARLSGPRSSSPRSARLAGTQP